MVKRRLWLALPLLLAVTVGLLTIDGGFVRDDPYAIIKNPIVIESRPMMEAVSRIATHDFWGNPLSQPILVYRPLAPLIWNILWRLDPGSSFMFRLFSLVLHVIVVWLVYLLTNRLFESRRVALISAALFAVHPVHAEALGSLVSHADMMAALLGSAAVVLAYRAVAGEDPDIHSFWLAGLLILLACLAKESAIIFVPIVAVLPFLTRDKNAKRRFFMVVPVLLVFTAYVAFQFQLTRVPHGGGSWTPVNDATTPGEMIMAGLYVIGCGVALCFVPINLSPSFHDYAQVDLAYQTLLPYAIPGLFFLVLGILGIWWSCRSRRPAFFVLFCMLFGPILIMTNRWTFPTAFAERMLYTSSIAACLLMATVMERRIRDLRLLRALTILACAVFLAQSWSYQRPWRQDPELFRAATRFAPLSAQANRGYCLYLFRQNRTFEGACYYLIYKYLQIMHYYGIPKNIFEEEILSLTNAPLASSEQNDRDNRMRQWLLTAPERLWPRDPCLLVREVLAGIGKSFPTHAGAVSDLFRGDLRYRECGARPTLPDIDAKSFGDQTRP